MKEDRKIKNVVLIMLDTLQFNYLGCYGNKVVKTPNIDRLARQGFLFENAYSEGLPTVPVRRALMTGRFTLPYGGWQPLAPDDTTVADIMWGKNMQTALVYDTPPMRLPKYGYSRGFDFVSFNPGQELDHTRSRKTTPPPRWFSMKKAKSSTTTARSSSTKSAASCASSSSASPKTAIFPAS